MSWALDPPVTTLVLVRHGQASYLEGDSYDRLSPLGERQARLLGEYWGRRGVPFDAVFSGPAERHRRTAEIAAAAAASQGAAWPPARILDGFDEFPGEEIMRKLGPLLLESHAHIREMFTAFENASEKQERKRVLDRLFYEVAVRWVDEEVSSPEVETWTEFYARVQAAVNEALRAVPPGGRAVVFTSGGPTAVAASLALDIPPRKTLELAFSPRNASFTEFLFTGGVLRLSAFNSFPHLDSRPELLTYR